MRPASAIVGHQYVFGFPVERDEPAYLPAQVPSSFLWMSASDLATWLRRLRVSVQGSWAPPVSDRTSVISLALHQAAISSATLFIVSPSLAASTN